MVRIEDLQPGIALVGLEATGVATIAAVVPISDDSMQVLYRTGDGTLRERLVGRVDEASLSVATVERPWSFDGDGEAFQMTGSRKGSVGFALTALQRRLASSPEATYQSLKRRKERLESRLREEKLGIRGRRALAETLEEVPEDDDDLNAEEQENLEETLVDDATAAKSIYELEAEIEILKGLEEQARDVVASGQDRKWDELSKILQYAPEMRRMEKGSLIQDVLDGSWIRADQEQRAVALAANTLVPDHFREVHGRRVAHVDKALAAVHERLSKEIAFWSDRWLKLKEDQEAGKDVRLNVENARRTVTDLEGRLENRKKELRSMRHVVNGTPVVLGGALVVPAGLMRKARGDEESAPNVSADPIARSRIERIAMDAVRQVEESQGCHVVDVSADKCGWDLTSYPPAIDHKQPDPRHIEVKGRVKGADTITVTRNEMLYAFNQGDKFILAIVLVNEDDSHEGPYYVRRPFDREPGWGVCSINYKLSDLLAKAEARHA